MYVYDREKLPLNHFWELKGKHACILLAYALRVGERKKINIIFYNLTLHSQSHNYNKCIVDK